MKFIVPGILLGALLALFMLPVHHAGEVVPRWKVSLDNLGSLEREPTQVNGPFANIHYHDDLYTLSVNARLLSTYPVKAPMVSLSGDGSFYAGYEKTGKEVQFFDRMGQRFWKMHSREYPLVSRSGNVILMVVGDQSRVRVLTRDGTEAPAGSIYGRLMTTHAFSSRDDWAAFGFISGRFYIISPTGTLHYKGMTPGGGAVKSLALTPTRALVHYHGREQDRLCAVDLVEKVMVADVSLSQRYYTKRPLWVGRDDSGLFVEGNNLLALDKDLDTLFRVPVGDVYPGHGSFVGHGWYAAGFRTGEGHARLMMVNHRGETMLVDDLKQDAYINLTLKKKVLFVRGTGHYYCYTLLNQDRL